MARTTPVNSGYEIITGSTTGSNAHLVDTWLEYKVISQDVASLTSTVRVLLYSASTRSSTTSWAVAEEFGYVQADGGTKQYLNTTYNFADYAANCFGDYTFTISHNNDGTKTVNFAGAWSTSHSTHISGGSASGDVILPVIERGIVSIDIGDKIVKAIPYIDTGSELKRIAAYGDTGNTFDICV